MKACPFCGGVPGVSKDDGKRVACPECGITMALDVWEGRADVMHDIEGKSWVTDGKRIYLESCPPALCIRRSQLVKMMNEGPWLPAIPDGYGRTGGIWYVHRYLVGGEPVWVNPDLEGGWAGVTDVDAKAAGGGYCLRYSVGGEPVLFVQSLRLDVDEVK